MSRMDKLIAAHCPDGVPHVQLHSVAEYSGSRIDATEVSPANFVGVDNLLPDKRGRTDATYFPNTARLTAFKEGDVLLGNIRPYLKKVWLADRSGGCSGDVLAIRINTEFRDRLAPEFLYYLLSSDAFFTYNMQHAKGAKMPRGSKPAILRYVVPVPPLEVQQEIVRILDKFTQLEAELEAELEARQKQYAHYRDHLLTFADSRESVRWVPMSEVGTFIRGGGPQKKDFVDQGIGCIHYGQIYTHYGPYAHETLSCIAPDVAANSRMARPGDVVIAVTSENDEDLGKSVAWLGQDAVAISNHTLIYTSDLNPKFVAYFLSSESFQVQKRRHITGAKVRALPTKAFDSIQIPIPSRAVQNGVVQTLDSFDALVNDLSSGLPAEIVARRRQYEYYRDRLLTFKELAS